MRSQFRSVYNPQVPRLTDDLNDLDTRVGSAETTLTNHDTRIDTAQSDADAAALAASAAASDASTAISAASTAQSTADDAATAAAAKNATFVQSSVPTALAARDEWIKTDDHNRRYVAASAGADSIAPGEWEEATTRVMGAGSSGSGMLVDDATGNILIFGELTSEGNIYTSEYLTGFSGLAVAGDGIWNPEPTEPGVLVDDNLIVTGTVDATMGDGGVGTGTFRDSVDARVTSLAAIEGAWQSASLASNWSNAGAGNETAQYRKVGTTVELKGLILRSTTNAAAGVTIFTLPAGYRPSTIQTFAAFVTTAGYSAVIAAVIQVTTGGVVNCISSAVNAGVLVSVHGSIYSGV